MKKLLYINIDGFSYSYYERLRARGGTAVFDALAQKGVFFSNLKSGLVSITNPMQSAILCGAFSNKTHNFYQHFDVKTGKVVKHLRTFDAKNIAEVMAENGKTVVSIHQFMLENNPCREGVKNCCYFKSDKEKSNYADRLAILNDIVLSRPVYSGGKTFVYDEFPDFAALYIDDIDSLGHNNDYEKYPKRALYEDRLCDIDQRLMDIQDALAEFWENARRVGLDKNLTVVLTTDHGMTPFYGKSLLGDVCMLLTEAGFTTRTAYEANENALFVALPYTIELSLYATRVLSADEIEKVKSVLTAAKYIDRVFDKKEMTDSFGMDERCPDFLISPKRGKHFYTKDVPENTFGASHDSFDATSQHIFGMMFGGLDGKRVDYPVSVIDLLPTALCRLFGFALPDATGKIHDDWF